MVKYSENPKELSTSYIDSLLRLESPSSREEAEAACRFREWLVLDDQDEFLKREYRIEEYGGKITQLSEYYKFHNDIPRVVELGVEKIMSRFYDKKRECDYKRIKKVLKAEQGLSITSVQESSSNISDSQAVRKSKYSTLLHAISHTNTNALSQANLNDLSDSKMLYDLCRQMDKALPQGKSEPFVIKGSFPEDRTFEYYLKSEEQKLKDRLRERNKTRQAGKVLKKFNYEEFMKSREKASDESKEVKPKEDKKPEK